MRRNKKWSAERREKFMNTLRNKKNHKAENDLQTFLDEVWNGLNQHEKVAVIVKTMQRGLARD